MTLTVHVPMTVATDAEGIQPLRLVPRRWSQTSLNVGIITRRIADVISDWESATTAAFRSGPAAPTSSWVAPWATVVHGVAEPRAYPTDPVDAVAFLSRVLQVSQDEVLRASGIAERTFFGWKSRGRRPRRSSTGKLWPLVEAIYYLADSHPNLAAWIRTTPAAQDAFAAGEADRLVGLELADALQQQPSHSFDLPDFGDLGDWSAAEPTPRRHTFTNDGVQSTSFRR